MKFSLAQQIDEIDRELGKRRDVCPGLVRSGKLRQSVADFQVDRLTAAKRTLEWVRDHEPTIRQAIGDRPE